jgi:cyanophycin synthetase
MEVSRVRALRGPNLWCRQTVIEAIVSCSEVERVIDDVDAFETRLRARFPDIDILRAPSQEAADSLAHALAYATLRLQTQAGCLVAFSRASATSELGVYQVVVEYSEEAVGRLAFELAQQLCAAAMQDLPIDLTEGLKRLREQL